MYNGHDIYVVYRPHYSGNDVYWVTLHKQKAQLVAQELFHNLKYSYNIYWVNKVKVRGYYASTHHKELKQVYNRIEEKLRILRADFEHSATPELVYQKITRFQAFKDLIISVLN